MTYILQAGSGCYIGLGKPFAGVMKDKTQLETVTNLNLYNCATYVVRRAY